MTTNQSSAFVDKYYEMNPTIEDVIPTGRFLREGMMVLLEDSSKKGNLEDNKAPHNQEILRKMNRWCEVTHLQFEGKIVRFLGVYQDGVKKKRINDIGDAWIVKLASVPRCSNPECKEAGYCLLDNGLVRLCIVMF